jgi:hypothetical protein
MWQILLCKRKLFTNQNCYKLRVPFICINCKHFNARFHHRVQCDDIPKDQPPKHPHNFDCMNIQATFLHVCTDQPTCAIPHLLNHDILVAPMIRSVMPSTQFMSRFRNLACHWNLIQKWTLRSRSNTTNCRKSLKQALPDPRLSNNCNG